MELNHFLQIIKALWLTLFSWIAATLFYFLPIRDLMYAITFIFAFNFICGYLAGMITQSESFDIKKGIWAFAEVACYICFLILLFVLGTWIKQRDWLITSIQTATYAWIYFYSINILKNLKRVFFNSKPIAFLYFLLSLEFVKKIPYMKEFEENQKKQQTK